MIFSNTQETGFVNELVKPYFYSYKFNFKLDIKRLSELFIVILNKAN